MASDDSGAFMAFLSGALLGAIAGILMAPRSGEETRQQVRDYADRAAKRLREAGETVGEAVTENAERVRRTIKNARHETRPNGENIALSEGM